ncbi:5-(carboxyamino)imidazole ribonucleotide mutase [Rhodocaloribacter litoris]|uniref:5-(carboxyamino)imidazole ribonucleotide mutase n=1 Tax=Rhodocaloribacter litoris TaxID=2558931 RepID=UPI00142082D1|nr:5-(carboxyamino)imidazole ribonucleotide mutase [Rhodocaloribacter litoris]QXD14699.1 5-(carboxyamino)imidazole ribonucleotide mutase [Rhodocaloribacter litoris]GIV59211.1 MAG: N5-carboxyaminoimidazole ribonucleotide mutase [Rhodothermaceae bacterium]
MPNPVSPLVGIAMGSESDWPVMEPVARVLDAFEVPYEVRVLSAHRTPAVMQAYAETAHQRGLKVLVAGAGGAAHLPGMLAASTPLPVIGVPVPSRHLNGLDSLLSVVQMPGGVPVATVAIGGGKNAGLLAVQILAAGDPALLQKMIDYKAALIEQVQAMDARVREKARPEASGP